MTDESLTTAAPRKKAGGAHGRPVPFLHAWRDSKLVSATELAEKTATSRANISRIERGGNASYKVIKGIAKALRISTDDLLNTNPQA